MKYNVSFQFMWTNNIRTAFLLHWHCPLISNTQLISSSLCCRHRHSAFPSNHRSEKTLRNKFSFLIADSTKEEGWGEKKEGRNEEKR